jgi:hypothetical protein
MQMAIEAVERMFKAIEAGDVSDADHYIAEDYINRDSADDGRSEKRGRKNFGRPRSGFVSRFPICILRTSR